MKMTSEWRITKEHAYYWESGKTSHKAWTLYFRGKRVARYINWDRAIQHIETYYRKFVCSCGHPVSEHWSGVEAGPTTNPVYWITCPGDEDEPCGGEHSWG